MKVTGISGWLYDTNISFGGYEALDMQRGWTKGSNAFFFPSINIDIEKSKKTSFIQKSFDGSEAKVFLLEECSRQGVEISRLAINDTHSKHFFAGKIIPKKQTDNTWEFNRDVHGETAKTSVTDQKGNEIIIDGNNLLIDAHIVAGYRTDVFVKNWQPTVEYVWITDDISAEQKLIVATLITIFMGRQGITCSNASDT
ncbi:MAG: hypothetical protein HRT53_04610 [Colwellia sp.]|nr:hypothetical protein [Colwellia sp.]